MGVTRGQSTRQRAQAIDKEARAAQVLDLARQRMPQQMIADHFGISRATVSRDLRDTLEEVRAQRLAMGELVYEDHLRLIDSCIAALQKTVFNNAGKIVNLDGLKELRGWLDQRARLLNLYPSGAPVSETTTNNYFLNIGSASSPAVLPEGETVQGTARRRVNDEAEHDEAEHDDA